MGCFIKLLSVGHVKRSSLTLRAERAHLFGSVGETVAKMIEGQCY